jgi:hypothetical protein
MQVTVNPVRSIGIARDTDIDWLRS